MSGLYVVLRPQPLESGEVVEEAFDDAAQAVLFAMELPEDAYPLRVKAYARYAPPLSAVIDVIEQALLRASRDEGSALHYPKMADLLRNAEDLRDCVGSFAADFRRRVVWPDREDALLASLDLVAGSAAELAPLLRKIVCE